MKGQLRRPFSTLIGSTNMFICLFKHVNLLSTHFATVTLDIKYMHSFPEDPSFDISKEMYAGWMQKTPGQETYDVDFGVSPMEFYEMWQDLMKKVNFTTVASI